MTRRRKAIVSVALGIAAGVAVAAIIWPTSTHQWARPLLAGTDLSSYVATRSTPLLDCPSGATSCLTCPMTDLGGNLQCSDQAGAAVELTKTGSPIYQTRTNLPANGKGRRGWNFDRATQENVAHSSGTALAIGSETEWTQEISFVIRQWADYEGLMGTIGGYLSTSVPGYQIAVAANGYLACNISAGSGTARYCRLSSVPTLNEVHTFACTMKRTGGTWGDPTLYLDGKPAASPVCSGTAPTTDISNHQAFAIGRAATAMALDGVVYEARLSNKERTAAELLAAYRKTITDGEYWTDDANTIGHWTFAESTTGSGLIDASGNGNHLTAVTGTPDADYNSPPWPMGSGFERRGVAFDGSTSYFVAPAGVGQQGTNDFSASFWINTKSDIADQDRIVGNRSTSSWEVYMQGTDALAIYLSDGGGTFVFGQISATGSLPYGTWHLVTLAFDRDVGVKAWIDGEDRTYSSPPNITTEPGALTSSNNLHVGRYANGATNYLPAQLAGLVISDTLTSLADHQALYKLGPPSDVTYAQTTQRCWPLPSEPGFGLRVGCWGAGQWPAAYASTLVDGDNPYGVGFPAWQATTNGITYSQQLDQWTPSDATVIADDTEAPDGSITADRLAQTVTTAYHVVSSANTLAVAQGEIAEVSIYAKAGSGLSYVDLMLQESAASNYVYNTFSLASGAGTCGRVGTNWEEPYCESESLGGGWHRQTARGKCVRVGGCTAGLALCLDNQSGACSNPAGSTSNYFWAWGGSGNTVSNRAPASYAYCPTGASPATCNKSTYSQTLVQIENLFVGSDDLDITAWWDRTALTAVHRNDTADPFGGTAAEALQADGSPGAHYISQTPGGLDSDEIYCWSAYAKAGTLDWAILYASPSGIGASYNVSTATKGSVTFGPIIDYGASDAGSGWAKIWLRGKFTASEQFRLYSAEADGDSSFSGDTTKQTYFFRSSLSRGACPDVALKSGPLPESRLGPSMPDELSRGEIVVKAAAKPETHALSITRTLAAIDDWATVHEGMQPAFVVRGRSGAPAGVSKGKPLTPGERGTEYRGSWDFVDGLTNTNPRRYAALSLGGKTQSIQLSQGGAEGVNQTDGTGGVLYVGCDKDGNNCADAVIASAQVFGRPAQVQREIDPALLVNADLTGPSYLENASWLPLFCPSGVASTDCWIWYPGAALGGSLHDVQQGAELVQNTGTPIFGVPTGILARGQGRRGWNFASGEYVVAAADTVLQLPTAFTIAVIFDPDNISSAQGLVAKRTAFTAGVWELYINTSATLQFTHYDGSTQRHTATTTNAIANRPTLAEFSMTGTTGSKWFVNGADVTVGGGADYSGKTFGGTGHLAVIGAIASGGSNSFDGRIYRIQIRPSTTDAAAAKANYRAFVDTGKYPACSGCLADYVFAEDGTSGGLRDSSGNSEHFTSVTGTPDVQKAELAWPAGDKLSSVQYGPALTYHEDLNDNVWKVSGFDPFGAVLWVMVPQVPTATERVLLVRDSSTEYISIDLHTNGTAYGYIYPTTAFSGAYNSAVISDGLWHLLAVKFVWTGSAWRVWLSVDGGEFQSNGSTEGATGDPSVITEGLRIGAAWASSAPAGVNIAGVMLVDNYELTNADMAAFYRGGDIWADADPTPDDLLYWYGRSNKACYEVGVHDVRGSQVRCFDGYIVPYAYDPTLCDLPGNDKLCIGEPVHGAVENLLTYSEQIDQWASQANATRIANTTIAPDGTLTADTIKEDATSGVEHYITSNAVTLADTGGGNAKYAYGLWAKAINRTWVYLQRGTHNASFNLATCAVGTSNNVQTLTRGAGGGWCWVEIDTRAGNYPAPGSNSFFIKVGEADNDIVFDGGNQDSIAVWGAQVVQPDIWPYVYCPTGAAAYTCNAVVDNYVDSSYLTGWDRDDAIIATAFRPASNVTEALPFVVDASGLTTAVRLDALSDARVFNTSGLLYVDLNSPGIDTGLQGGVLVYDGDSPVLGTRYARVNWFANSFAWPWEDYDANSGPFVMDPDGTDLHIGLDYDDTNQINGVHAGAQIWDLN